MNIIIIRRSGVIKPSKSTQNQCANTGKKYYKYNVSLAFENPKLDNKGFVVDHNKIDEIVKSLPSKGSCEQVADAIQKTLKAELSFTGLKAISIEIKPDEITVASLKYLWCFNRSYIGIF